MMTISSLTVWTCLAALMTLGAADSGGSSGAGLNPDMHTTEELRAELAILADRALLPQALRGINQLVQPSVVSIHTSDRLLLRSWGRVIESREVEAGEGSGFVVASDAEHSWLITNAHVVIRTDGSQRLIRERNKPVWHQTITVQTTDGQIYQASPVGVDPATDLAVIRIDVAHLPPITWGDSDGIDIGDWVLALGYPLGVGYSATTGIISATARSTGISRNQGYESFLQTDAAINPGNSGGPMVNLRGEVIGVNAHILSRTGVNIGIGFAIPANLAARVARDLIDDGRISRPMFGIEMQAIDPALASQRGIPNTRGVAIEMVFPASPAESAGLRMGDVIMAIDDVQVTSVQQLKSHIASIPEDSSVNMTYWREGVIGQSELTPVSEDEMLARLEQLARERLRSVVNWPRYGLSLGRDAQRGAVITQVTPNGPAAAAGLRIGDRILRVYGFGPVTELPPLNRLDQEAELVLQVLHRSELLIIRLQGR